MLPVALDLIASTAFLDQRMDVDWHAAERVPWQALRPEPPAAPPALLFHTAFCGSTLLARVLQAPPDVVALREPEALLMLAEFDARLAPGAIEGPLDTVLRLLARPWRDGGHCLIKPTSLANTLLPAILRLTGGKAILLYSSLADFVVSSCRKLPRVENYVQSAAHQLLARSTLPSRLGLPRGRPLHFAQACVLGWYAQMEIYADALAADGADRLRSLDFARLLESAGDIVPACARWYGFEGDAALWQRNVQMEFGRNAKETTRAFDAHERGREHDEARRRHAGLIDAALRWAEAVVAPVARMPVWKPVLASPVAGETNRESGD
jgi:hypothetical protein